MKYRKKPVAIEAMQLTYNTELGVRQWLEKYNEPWRMTNNGLSITTLEGDMLASWDDYIIRGVKGEFYPCKPDIFEATYDSID